MTRRRSPSPPIRRRVGTREPKKRVVVICEGAKTEPSYFRLLNSRARSALVELEIVDEDSTSPKQLVERACAVLVESERVKRRTKDPNTKIDEIWCVFDVDEHQMIREACQQADARNIKVAVSNPCIELWFLLHFRDYSAFIDRHEALRLLKAELPGYEKALETIQPLLERYEVAKERALKLDDKHSGDQTPFPHNNPASGLWRLVDSLEAAY